MHLRRIGRAVCTRQYLQGDGDSARRCTRLPRQVPVVQRFVQSSRFLLVPVLHTGFYDSHHSAAGVVEEVVHHTGSLATWAGGSMSGSAAM